MWKISHLFSAYVAICKGQLRHHIQNMITPPGSARFQLNVRSTLHVNSQIIWLSDLFIVRLVHKTAKSDYKLHHVCHILCSSFRLSAWNYSAPTRRIFTKFDILLFFENAMRKFEFDWILKRKTNIYVRTDIRIWLHLAQFFLEWEIFKSSL